MNASEEQALRIVRFFKWSFVVGGAGLIFIVVKTPIAANRTPSTVLELAIFAMAATSVLGGFFVPRLITITPSVSLLADSVSAPTKLWFMRCVLSLACFDACNLFAVVLHFIGARVWSVEILFTLGMLSLIFWSPGVPKSEEQPLISRD